MVKIIDCNVFESGAEVICHQVNCKGSMENGVAKQVKDRYPQVCEAYERACCAVQSSKDLLGTVCDVSVSEGGKTLVICSLFGQDNYSGSGFCFTDYAALGACLEKVRDKYKDKRIALPYRMSCSLMGGDWRIVEKLILDILGGCDVTVCRHYIKE